MSRTITVECDNWNALREQVRACYREFRAVWFRGECSDAFKLLPSLMRDTLGLTNAEHDLYEQDTFFEFQARAGELRGLNLDDWEYLFYARHYGLPSRVLDWTENFGVALYFAVANEALKGRPCLWLIDPYQLNYITVGVEEIVLPRYLGQVDEDYWDYGELLADPNEWTWEEPAAIYPLQNNTRVRAQQGWFTIHGASREPLENQVPNLCVKLIIGEPCMSEAREFLQFAGINRYSVYPDLENLALQIRKQNLERVADRRGGQTVRGRK